ncbi:hypothetical protein JCM14076_18470 [Methylosoma difficile]
MNTPILINDLLNFQSLEGVKIRFVKSNSIDDPLELFKHNRQQLLNWQFWNYEKKKSFHEGEIAVGFVKISEDKWLLFDISKITKDLNKFNAVGYEYKTEDAYAKYFGRVIIQYKNKSQNLVRKACSVIEECKVAQILEDTFNDDVFPGYENINIPWLRLEKVINNSAWKAALENQKGVYLITDKSNGKMYVGSAYGENMIHGRWSSYIISSHGGNKELKELAPNYIKENFTYSILEIYKSTVDDSVILNRESWWKDVLLTRKYGYNSN